MAQGVPERERGVDVRGVNAFLREDAVLEFEVAAGPERIEGGREDRLCGLQSEAGEEHAAVDEVKGM